MNKKVNGEKEATDRLRQLLNANFGEKDIGIVIVYENSIKNGSKNGQQVIN